MAEYIERAAAVEAFENGEADVIENYGDGCDFGFGIKNIKDVLSVIPAADVAPVRHARWIPEENGDVYFSCSYCGCEISTSWDYDDLEWNFCPECGCEMTSGTQPQREEEE